MDTRIENRLPLRLTAIDRNAIERWLAWTAAIGLVACVAGALYVRVAWNSWPAARYLLLYVAPICLVAPWWMHERIRTLDHAASLPRGRLLLDAAVLVLAVARFGIGEGLPFSGHMLFLVYSVLTTPARGYRIVATVLLLETTAFKLWIWRDVSSWELGLALGLVAALFARVLRRRVAAR